MTLDAADRALLWIDADKLEPLARDLIRMLLDELEAAEAEGRDELRDLAVEARQAIQREDYDGADDALLAIIEGGR